MNKKILLYILYALSGLSLMAIGAGIGYKLTEHKSASQQTVSNKELGQTQNKGTTQDANSNRPTGKSPTTKDLSYLNKISWQTYKDSKYRNITFKYPKGAKITKNNDTKNMHYIVTATYKDLVIKADKITGGIGGTPYPVFSYNRIIYDTKFLPDGINGYAYWGIYALDNSTKDYVVYSYNTFDLVRRQSVNDTNFTVSLPKDGFKKEYLNIMDTIGASFYKLNTHINKSGVPYYSNKTSTIYGIDNFNSFKIKQLSNKERFEDMYVNHPIDYVAYLIKEADGKIYLYTYDLKNKKHISLSGQNKVGPFNMLNSAADDGMVVWFDDYKYAFANLDTNKYYIADVKSQTLKQVSKNEFEMYTAHQ